MATRTRADDIEALRKKVLGSVHRIVDGEAEVSVGWLGESAEEEEVLVQITLPDPGEGKTWDQGVTNEIRTVVRAAGSGWGRWLKASPPIHWIPISCSNTPSG